MLYGIYKGLFAMPCLISACPTSCASQRRCRAGLRRHTRPLLIILTGSTQRPWLELDGDLRAALQGSTLAPDGGLDVRADRYEVIRARFASPVHDLLTAA